MKSLVLIALAACSLGVLTQAANIPEEPSKLLDEVQGNDSGAKEETIDSSDEGFEDDLNEDNAPSEDDDEEEDEQVEDEEREDVDDEDEDAVDEEEYDEDVMDDPKR